MLKSLLTLLCILFSAHSAFGQSTFGTIQGTIRDASDAVIPNAKVTIRNVGTNVSLQTMTNELGNYEMPNLNPGSYEVTVEASSFKKFVHTGIVLNARQVARIDARVEVSGTEVGVTITATGTPVVATETATIDDARTNSEILSLPLNFRAANTSLISVIALAPGVQVRSGSENFSIAGSRLSQNETSIDGISTLGMRNHDVLVNMFPSSETVSEIRVSSVSNSAEYQGASNVDTISRSGQNTFHGSLFEYHQNGALDARNTFSPTVPFKVANTFGGSLGGPLIFPHLYSGRNRTFFFITYEGNRRAAKQLLTPTVPSLALRRGDFSQVSGLTLRDPLTGVPFPGNQIPSERLNSTSLGLQEYYPQPNFGAANLLSANFRGTFPISVKSDQFDVRLDHNAGSKHLMFARFSFKNLNDGTSNFTLPTIGPSRETPHVRSLVASESWTISPRFVMNCAGDLPGSGAELKVPITDRAPFSG